MTSESFVYPYTPSPSAFWIVHVQKSCNFPRSIFIGGNHLFRSYKRHLRMAPPTEPRRRFATVKKVNKAGEHASPRLAMWHHPTCQIQGEGDSAAPLPRIHETGGCVAVSRPICIKARGRWSTQNEARRRSNSRAVLGSKGLDS